MSNQSLLYKIFLQNKTGGIFFFLFILMFTHYKAQEPLNVDGYRVVLYEGKKRKEVKFMKLCKKKTVNYRLESIRSLSSKFEVCLKSNGTGVKPFISISYNKLHGLPFKLIHIESNAFFNPSVPRFVIATLLIASTPLK